MKPIKIIPENKLIIEQALATANGKAREHTYTSYEEIASLAQSEETSCQKFGLTLKDRVGVKITCQSGAVLPNAYKFKARTTTVRIERRGSGWWLIEVWGSGLQPKVKPVHTMQVSPEQVAAATKRLLARFDATVIEPQPVALAVAA